MPLLRLAKEVVVVAVSEGDRISEAASLGDVVAWLGKHEVKASETIVSAGAGGIGCSMKKFAHSNADLIVSGAYGHSRAREWLL